MCVGGLEVGFFAACSWLALVAGVGGYIVVGVEIGVLFCIFLYFCERRISLGMGSENIRRSKLMK